MQCGVLWLRAGFALLQLLAAAAPLPSLPLLLLLVGPAMVWCKANYRLAAAYGPAGVLLSPVLGWLPLLVAVWCHTVRKQMGVVDGWGVGGCCTKGAWRMRTECCARAGGFRYKIRNANTCHSALLHNNTSTLSAISFDALYRLCIVTTLYFGNECVTSPEQ
jgi:hypothetical protein